MKIAIDIRAMTGHPSGIGNYCGNLLTGLAKVDGNCKYYLYSNRKVLLPEVSPKGTTLIIEPYLIGNLWLQTRLPKLLSKAQTDCFHGTNFLAPLKCPCPTVVTVHDLSSFQTPHMHTLSNNLVQRLVPSAVKKARKVIAPSRTTKKFMVERFGTDPEKIAVIHNAVPPVFQPIYDNKAISAFRKKWMLPESFILFVGTLEPRKNLSGLMRGFSRLVKKVGARHSLVVVGDPGWGCREILRSHARLGLGDKVRFLGYVPNSELPKLYNAADAFAYLSHGEGFGLPVLESLACGTPTVISRDPALIEVAGKLAIRADAEDPESIAQALEKSLAPQQRSPENIQNRINRAGMFSLDDFAEATLSVYRDAGGN